MCMMLALHAQDCHRYLVLNTWLHVYDACIACMVAVPRTMLCELMSSFDIPDQGREDAGEGHSGGERGGSRIGSPLCLSHVSSLS